jgi:integrase
MEYTKATNRTNVRFTGESLVKAVRSERAAAARKGKRRAAPGAGRAATAAAAKAAAAQNKVAMAELIDNWQPGRGFEEVAEVWSDVAPVVREILLNFEYQNEKSARRWVGALARHTAARFSAGHLITPPEVLLSEDALAATYGVQNESKNAKSTRRRELIDLRKMRAKLLPETYGVRRELKYGSKSAPAMFSETELAQLFAYARQRSAPNAKHLQAAMPLSLGAGFSGGEMGRVRTGDLFCTPWGLVIKSSGLTSGGNRGERIVPILAKYEDELSQLAKEFGSALFLGSTRSGKPREACELHPRRSDLPIFKTNRARSNWMRALLENEVSFTAMRLAGVAILKEGFLNELSADLTPSIESYVKSVRGGAKPFDPSKHSHLAQYEVGK